MPWYVYANYDLSQWKCKKCNILQGCNGSCSYCQTERKQYFECESVNGYAHVHLQKIPCSFDPRDRRQYRCYEFTAFEKPLQHLVKDNRYIAYYCNACKTIMTSKCPETELSRETSGFHFSQKIFYYPQENQNRNKNKKKIKNKNKNEILLVFGFYSVKWNTT
jgi:hypothetical protein